MKKVRSRILQTKESLLRLALLLQRKQFWKLWGRQVTKESTFILVGLVSPDTHYSQWGRMLQWGESQSWSNSELLSGGIPSLPVEEPQEAGFPWPQTGFVHLVLWNSLKRIKGDTDIPSQERGVLAGECFLHLPKERHFQSVARGQRAPGVSGTQAKLHPGWFSLSGINTFFP